MEVENLEDALDEFDTRYLECYYQMTSKLAALALDLLLLLTLSSPLLGPRDDDDIPRGTPVTMLHMTPSMYYDQMPSKMSKNDAMAIGTLRELTDVTTSISATIHDIPCLSDIPDMPTTTIDLPAVKTDLTKAVPLADIPDIPVTISLDSTHAPCVYSSCGIDAPPQRLQRSFTQVGTVHTMRMHRLLLALQLTPKLHTRRGERRSTVATYVGNPFYRGRTSPQHRRSVSTLTSNSCTNAVTPNSTKRCTFEIGEEHLTRRGRTDLDEPVYR